MLNISKNPPEADKVAILVKFLNVEKTQAFFPHQDFEILFFSTLFNTYVYRRVSFSAVDIIISKQDEIFGPNIFMMETTISIFIESAHWAKKIQQLQCPCECVCVCLSLFMWYMLRPILPPLPKIGCPKILEIRNPWGKVLERIGFRIEHFCWDVV